jgi:aerobic carbon-monoxide dehydrogenase small subunit
MSQALRVRLTVNDESIDRLVSANRTLAEFLRRDLQLTGTKVGCDTGDCGACTVLLDDEPVASCLVLAVEADAHRVRTVEGLSPGPSLHPLQQAFVDEGAVQCGYCTPGMLIASVALLSRNPSPSESEIRQGLAGNLCRCTGYVRIVEAVSRASRGAR